MKQLFILGIIIILTVSSVYASNMYILKDDFPDTSNKFYNQLKSQIDTSGYSIKEVNFADLKSCLDSIKDSGNILILPNARYFPVDASDTLQSFLRNHNHLLAITGPVFENTVQNIGGRWITKQDAVNGDAPLKGRVFIDFGKQGIDDWHRSIGTEGNKAEYTVESTGHDDLQSTLRVDFDPLEGWELFDSPPIYGTIPQGCKAISFRTNTKAATHVGIQCRERDGSRWIANIQIPAGEKRFVLTENDFNIWRDRIPPGRAGGNDHLHLDNTENICFIFSKDYDKSSKRSLSISNIQAIEDGSIFTFIPPVMETISPLYKVYRTHAYTGRIDNGKAFPLDAEIVSSHLRSCGYGSDDVRKWRFIPVMEVYGKGGNRLGTGAHIFLNNTLDYAGSTWGYIGVDQKTLDNDPDRYASLALSMLRRIKRNIFLANAGTEFFGYADGENTKYGSYITNYTDSPVNMEINYSIKTLKGKKVESHITKSIVEPNKSNKPQRVEGRTVTLPAGEYKISTMLKIDGKPVDEITHRFQVIKYHKLSDDEIVTVRNGDYYLHGKKWYGIGINYWPGSSSGFENVDLYGGHWLDPAQYDPDIIERDLALAKKLGMTMFSVQYLFKYQTRAFMDFLARAEKYGIKVNCFIDGLHPLGINMMRPSSDWKDHSVGKELIEAAHLSQTPAVFGYDVGWEVHLGHDTDRNQYNKQWQDWVIDRYGSIEAAENDWDFKPERVDGILASPSDTQITVDGPWRVYTAAYRRFWDDRISEGYRTVRADIKSVDPYHLIGARSGYGGTGSVGVAARFPFDLVSGVKHLDFTSPEAYILNGDRKNFLQGGFNVAYGRLVSGDKPVFWAEYGVPAILGISIPDYNHGRTFEDHAKQADFVNKMMDLCYETYSSASAGWWWPGGFRISENSDFGFTNPDGTPREAALEIRKVSEKLRKPRDIPQPDTYLTIDRDKYITGYAGLYMDLAPKYAELLVDGKFPGLKTEGTGTTSIDTPLTAVGNTPYNRHNPVKFLNAEFNSLKINGKPVTDDLVVEIEPGKPVYVEASVGNIGEAKWIASGNRAIGEVYLLAETNGDRILIPISSDTPFLNDANVKRTKLTDAVTEETEYSFRMLARGRAEFGEVLRVTLKTTAR